MLFSMATSCFSTPARFDSGRRPSFTATANEALAFLQHSIRYSAALEFLFSSFWLAMTSTMIRRALSTFSFFRISTESGVAKASVPVPSASPPPNRSSTSEDAAGTSTGNSSASLSRTSSRLFKIAGIWS